MVLVLEALPAKALLKFVFSIFFNKMHQIQRMVHIHSQHFLVPNRLNQNVHQWEVIGFAINVFTSNVPKQRLINAKVTAPFFGLTAAFRRKVRTGNNVLGAILAGNL